MEINKIYDSLSEESRNIMDSVVYCSEKLNIKSEELLEAVMIYADKIKEI